MGATNSTSNQRSGRVSMAPEYGRSMQVDKATLKEHKRCGVVVVKYQSSSGATRRNADNVISQVVTPRGVILYGTLYNPTTVQRAINTSGFPMLVPGEMAIPDSRAHRLLVSYCNGWHVVPFPEAFSRHSGTCYIVGDRTNTGAPFQIKVGDCFRLGSVGLVVSEMKLPDQEEQKLDAKTLQFLKDEALAFDLHEEYAQLASDELDQEDRVRSNGSSVDGLEKMGKSTRTMMEQENSSSKSNGRQGDSNGMEDDGNDPSSGERQEEHYSTKVGSGGVIGSSAEKFFCYMCYEMHNTVEDPLIAPCECKGDTRFLHVQCLQKWYHSSALGSHAQVIRTTGNGAPACKICGSAYKTNFRRHDGRKASILEMENNGPYISLVVVTHHDTNPGLFNTKFRLNFGHAAIQAPPTATLPPESALNTILIGRSSSCAMVLDYRTVSTTHAKITYNNGKFYLADERSSNGTLVYLQDPLPLPYGQSLKVRMGRTTISFQAKRSWTSALRSYVFGNPANTQQSPGSTSEHASSDAELEEGQSAERPSMSAHHHQQLQLHQQHLQQLRSRSSNADAMAEYAHLSNLLTSRMPSAGDVQAFLNGITAILVDPGKLESTMGNNPALLTAFLQSGTVNENNVNGAQNNQNGALLGSGLVPVENYASELNANSLRSAHGMPPSQPSERTLDNQESHYFSSLNGDEISTMDNTMIAPLRSGQPSFVMRHQLSNVSTLTMLHPCDNIVEEGGGPVSSAGVLHAIPSSTELALDEQKMESAAVNGVGVSGGGSQQLMMVSSARGVDDGSGIVLYNHAQDVVRHPRGIMSSQKSGCGKEEDHGQEVDGVMTTVPSVNTFVTVGQVSAAGTSAAASSSSMRPSSSSGKMRAIKAVNNAAVFSVNGSNASPEKVVTAIDSFNNNNSNSTAVAVGATEAGVAGITTTSAASAAAVDLIGETEILLNSLPAANRYGQPVSRSSTSANRSEASSPLPMNSSRLSGTGQTSANDSGKAAKSEENNGSLSAEKLH